MERNGDCLLGDNSHPKAAFDRGNSVLSSNIFLDKVGEVVLTHNSDGLSWKLIDASPGVRFLEITSEFFCSILLMFYRIQRTFWVLFFFPFIFFHVLGIGMSVGEDCGSLY